MVGRIRVERCILGVVEQERSGGNACGKRSMVGGGGGRVGRLGIGEV